jgi:hypothetical protein
MHGLGDLSVRSEHWRLSHSSFVLAVPGGWSGCCMWRLPLFWVLEVVLASVCSVDCGEKHPPAHTTRKQDAGRSRSLCWRSTDADPPPALTAHYLHLHQA